MSDVDQIGGKEMSISKNGIHVFGEGIVSVDANMVRITLGVLTEGVELQSIQTQNAQVSSQVIEALIVLGVKREDIRTVEYRIDPQYQYEEGKQQFVGYRVLHMLEIKTNQIKNAGTIVDLAVKTGANSVSNIEFTVENDEQYYQHALTLAANDAVRKADTLARSYGALVYRIPFLVEEIQPTSGPIPLSFTALKAEVQTPIEPGKLTIQARIKAYFHLLYPGK